MTDRDGASLLALPPSVLERRSLAALRDVRGYFEPDVTWVLGPERRPKAVARARQVFEEPVVHPPLGDGDPVKRLEGSGAGLVTVQRGSLLPDAIDAIDAASRDTGAVCVVCDDVTTTVRPDRLETTLEYAEELATALGDRELTTVLTGALPADYDRRWRLERSSGEVLAVERGALPGDGSRSADVASVRVRGCGSVEGYGDARSVSLATLAPDGVVAMETVDADAFGLEAVSGVGPKTATRLEAGGIENREALAETPIDALADLPGIGAERARSIRTHAAVLETGEPRRLTDESLPGASDPPPLCLDVETDGLSPTILWQIGVYDPVTDEHRAFLETDDPSDPAPVLESFLEWLLGVHPGRALLTWNGRRFDYRHLTAFVERYVPHYAAEWDSIPTFDLYGWSVRDENALLPGRTNRLEDVADALGYEGAGTGIDGASTAAAYERFLRSGRELEWERHRAYCEDDCRALWHVYERLRDAPVAGPSADSATDAVTATGDGAGKQTGLGDFTG